MPSFVVCEQTPVHVQYVVRRSKHSWALLLGHAFCASCAQHEGFCILYAADFLYQADHQQSRGPMHSKTVTCFPKLLCLPSENESGAPCTRSFAA